MSTCQGETNFSIRNGPFSGGHTDGRHRLQGCPRRSSVAGRRVATCPEATADDHEQPGAPLRGRWQLQMINENIEPFGAAAVLEGAPQREGFATAAMNSNRATHRHGWCSCARVFQAARADVVLAGACASVACLYAHCERQSMCMSMRVCREGPDGLSGRMGSAWADRRRSAAAHMSSSNLYHCCRSLYHSVCITVVDRRNVDLSSPVDHVNVWGCSIYYTCQIQCLTSCIQGTPAADM